MGLIDTHTHLESFARRGELEDVLARAWAAGLEGLVTIGTDPEDWTLYRDIAARHGGAVRYAAGLHPCSVDERWPEHFAALEAFWSGREGPVPVALGETGLDRFHLPPDDSAAAERIFGWQREAFAAALRLARRLSCPVVVHSRGAFRECVELVDASGVAWSKVVFHCFSEGPAEMAELLRRGGFGSFTGIITYRKADAVREAARLQGLDRLMLETDAPYLTPLPHRGKPNEPAYLRHTAEFCAGLFGVKPEELGRRTTARARDFYGF